MTQNVQNKHKHKHKHKVNVYACFEHYPKINKVNVYVCFEHYPMAYPMAYRWSIFVSRLAVTLLSGDSIWWNGGITKRRNGMAEHPEYSKTRTTRNILKHGIYGIF